MRRSARSSSGTAGSAPGSCCAASRRRSWPGRILTGLDRQRADAAGQQIAPVPGLASTTAAGLARRITPAQWEAVEQGVAAVTGQMLDLLPPERAAALAGGPVTIDLDTTDVEVYGRNKRGVAYNHQGQRVASHMWRPGPRPRSPWPLTWVTAPMTRARPRRACCAARWLPCPRGPGFGPGGAARRRGLLRRAAGPRRPRRADQLRDRRQEDRPAVAAAGRIAEDAWHDAIEMDGAQVTVARYCPDWWPADTALLIRRVRLDPAQVSADPRARRRRTLHPDQRALPFPELAEASPVYAYSFILTNLDVSTPSPAVAAEHWYRHRTTVENLFRNSKLGPRCGTSRPDIRRSTWHGCGARCSPRPWPPGCTSSPPPPSARTSCTATACAAARP